MTIIAVALVIVALAAGFALLQSKKYNGFKNAFGGGAKEQRQQLAKARSVVKKLRRSRAEEIQEAEQELDAVAKQVAALEEPGEGRKLARLGQVQLHEHVVVIKRAQVPLLGASCRCESSSASTHLYVVAADGRTHSHSFDTEWRATGKLTTDTRKEGDYDLVTATETMKRDFSDEEVRELAVAISNQILAQEQFAAELPGRLEAARSEQARLMQALDSCRVGSSIQTQLEAAEANLAETEQRWGDFVRSDE